MSNGARSILLIALIANIIATAIFAYGSSKIPNLIIVPSIFLGVFALILLILRFRYPLLERYPYLVNLPAFAYRLGIQKNPKTAGIVINRIFTVHALASLYVAVLYLIFAVTIMQQSGKFVWLEILVIVAAFIVAVFLQYRRIYLNFAH